MARVAVRNSHKMRRELNQADGDRINPDSLLFPPETVRGMITLDREKFKKTVKVPFLTAEKKKLSAVNAVLKPYFIRIVKFAPLRDVPGNDAVRSIILHPDKVKQVDNLGEKAIQTLDREGVDKTLQFCDLELTYDNFTCDEIFGAVLPLDKTGGSLTSWSIIGHIIHLNLKEELLPYKQLIGEVLCDKNEPYIKLVVNKVNAIENEFRFFPMEILAGRDGCTDTNVEIKAFGCVFKFDFAKVYWNPRLNTEHERIVSQLEKGYDVLYDVFAGVGPFAVPVAKKKCKVLANDLNPQSFKALQENAKINKVESNMTAFNLDGREFIRTVVKNDLIAEWKGFDCGDIVLVKKFHIAMNLPAMATEFLDAFKGWMDDDREDILKLKEITLPIVHCYCFIKGVFDDKPQEVVQKVEHVLEVKLEATDILKIIEVRNVAPNKDMFRISFKLPRAVIFTEPEPKRAKLN